MELCQNGLKLPCTVLAFINYIFFFIQFSSLGQFATSFDITFSNETDKLALLVFKRQITSDPLHVMSSWNNTIHFCNWEGVTCNGTKQRVTILNLSSHGLVGTISPHIANLTELTAINLGDNHLSGNIPQELGRLSRLQKLYLDSNHLEGEIPSNLSNCLELGKIDLIYNRLVGGIPSSLSSLTKLVKLSLAANNLSGTLPPALGNMSSLMVLILGGNSLGGDIPCDLGRLPRLLILNLSSNNFSGTIPASIYNLSELVIFSVSNNNLHGSIPASLSLYFPYLQSLYMGSNQFTGGIPVSLPNASDLVEAYFTYNQLTGPVSMSFGGLKYLQILSLGNNFLGTNGSNNMEFVESLTNCTNLRVLQLQVNKFKGQMPRSIVNLSAQMERLTLGENQLWGTIPEEIRSLSRLTFLSLDNSLLSGTIPPSMGKLNQLSELLLSSNKLCGSIPSTFGNFTKMSKLYLNENQLEGTIPSTLSDCRSLTVLNLSHNNFNGTIPSRLFNLPFLSISFNLAHNKLTGPLPSEVGDLVNLEELDISDNQISGYIPSSISKCVVLEILVLHNNKFQGPIPHSLSELKGLQRLDLSQNHLSGPIPAFLSKLHGLLLLNLSFNYFQGEVPIEGVFSNVSVVSLLGNQGLCGGAPGLNLPCCSNPSHKKHPNIVLIVILVVVIGVLSFISFIITIICMVKRRKKQQPHPNIHRANMGDRFPTVSYSDLFKATNGFSSSNMIGAGSYGTVYKGVLQDDETVIAVKVLDLDQIGALKSFTSECEALKQVRHRNLVKILTACSTIDRQGKEFKALVLEYMPCGSLEEWLHPHAESMQSRKLNLEQRLSIAIDVAAALDYLHNHCEIPVVHCDVKPSNILLDEELGAHLGDFGLARMLIMDSTPTSSQTKSAVLQGSIGYVAPEYGMGTNISLHRDVYSYGILILEMLTGKRPTDELFQQDLNLQGLVKLSLPHKVKEIIDPNMSLVLEEKEDDPNKVDRRLEKALSSMLEMGLRCSEESPRLRLDMKEVCKKLQSIRELIGKNRQSFNREWRVPVRIQRTVSKID